MSYKDLEEARARRAKQEATKQTRGNGKRGRKPKGIVQEAPEEEEEDNADNGKPCRKRKSAAAEGDVPEPQAKVARVNKAPPSAITPGANRGGPAPVAWMSEAQGPPPVAQMSETQELPKALVAWMRRSAKASEGLNGVDKRSAVAEDDVAARGMETHCPPLYLG